MKGIHQDDPSQSPRRTKMTEKIIISRRKYILQSKPNQILQKNDKFLQRKLL